MSTIGIDFLDPGFPTLLVVLTAALMVPPSLALLMVAGEAAHHAGCRATAPRGARAER